SKSENSQIKLQYLLLVELSNLELGYDPASKYKNELKSEYESVIEKDVKKNNYNVLKYVDTLKIKVSACFYFQNKLYIMIDNARISYVTFENNRFSDPIFVVDYANDRKPAAFVVHNNKTYTFFPTALRIYDMEEKKKYEIKCRNNF